MIYKIQDLIINTHNRTLIKGGVAEILTPKIYRLLMLFIDSGGVVVSKECIRKQVWCGQLVCEATLYKMVQRLRGLLGDDGEEQTIIKTIHGEGYMMVSKNKKAGFWTQLLKKIS